ncbi:SIS domain-containing protein [Dehalococcoides mccartyi]|nr:SIS domain-containing protein [Dehalococcoides mccartyi]
MSSAFDELTQALERSRTTLSVQVTELANMAKQTLDANRKIMFCGNGGSASEAQHLATELSGRYKNDRIPLAGISLTADSATITAIGNDYGFDEIFARQVAALGNEGDMLIGMSTSGNSRNVIRAIETANEIGIKTVGMTGRSGGLLSQICDLTLMVDSDITARVQEIHLLCGHMMCELIDEMLAE